MRPFVGKEPTDEVLVINATATALAGLLLLGLLLTPTPALAAPAIVATPGQNPPGGTITVSGIGFAPGAEFG